jgi:hypothetical protein
LVVGVARRKARGMVGVTVEMGKQQGAEEGLARVELEGMAMGAVVVGKWFQVGQAERAAG